MRAVLTDYNERVRLDRLLPRDPKMPPLIAPLIDVEAMVQRWRAL